MANGLENIKPQLQEEEIEIRKILDKISFDCPHCYKEINETHLDEKGRYFQSIKEKIRKTTEEMLNSQKAVQKKQLLEQIEAERSYEKFGEVIKKDKVIEELTITTKKLGEEILEIKLKSKEDLAKATSYDEIRKLEGFKELEKKVEKYQKEVEELKIGNQPEIQTLKGTIKTLEESIAKEKLETEKAKSSEEVEKLERVRKLVEENNELRNQNQSLRDQGRMSKKKGENFEQYILEELSRVFDNKDRISKITQMGVKADFIQEVLTENGEQVAGRIIYEAKNEKKWDPKWVNKLENDMANERADFGIIIAICENGKSLRCLDPRKKIYVSDDENFIHIAKIMRDSLIQKHNYLKKGDMDEDSKEKRIKNFEEWISSKLPQYLSRLENELTNLKKSSHHADKIIEITHNTEINIRKIILEEVRIELSNL